MFTRNFLENSFFPVFIRKCLQPFTAKELVAEFKDIGIKFSSKELEEFLECEPNIFSLANKSYLTYAGAFTGQIFSFIPTEQEVSQGVIVIGDRGVPFLDSEMFYFDVQLSAFGKRLTVKPFESDCNVVREIFYLHDDEITDQIVAKDPFNENLRIAERNFELPYKFYLSGFDVKELFEIVDFKFGDRLIAYVNDWDSGIVEIVPFKSVDTSSVYGLKFLREKWYDFLEESLFKSFERDGACSSINQQLANVFFDNRDTLCNVACGSIFEFLNRTKNISLEYFGVESRLWKRDEDVPAKLDGQFGFLIDLFYEVSDALIDGFLKDSFFEKRKFIELTGSLIDKILPNEMDLSFEDRLSLSLQIENRHDKLRKTYNWFADFAFGTLRHRAIAFYVELRNLFFEIELKEAELKKYPQSELVALAQFFSQTVSIIESIEENDNLDLKDTSEEDWKNVMALAVEGMESQLEYIRPILLEAFEQIKRERFSVI